MTLPDISRLSLQPHEAARIDAPVVNACNPDKPARGVCVRIRPHPSMFAVLSEPLLRWFRINVDTTSLVILGPRPPRGSLSLQPYHRWYYNDTPEQTLHESAEWNTLMSYLQGSFRDADIQMILGYQGAKGWTDLPNLTWEKLYENKMITYSKGKYINLCMRPYWGPEYAEHTMWFLKALRAYNIAHTPRWMQKRQEEEAAAASIAPTQTEHPQNPVRVLGL